MIPIENNNALMLPVACVAEPSSGEVKGHFQPIKTGHTAGTGFLHKEMTALYKILVDIKGPMWTFHLISVRGDFLFLYTGSIWLK